MFGKHNLILFHKILLRSSDHLGLLGHISLYKPLFTENHSIAFTFICFKPSFLALIVLSLWEGFASLEHRAMSANVFLL